MTVNEGNSAAIRVSALAIRRLSASADLAAVIEALKSVGLGLMDVKSKDRLVNIFAKAEASPDGCVRGFRHTMLDDSDVGSTRHARAAVGGLISGLSGTGAVYAQVAILLRSSLYSMP